MHRFGLITHTFELLIYRLLKQHFQNHNIFIAEQYGFTSGLSATNATHRLTEIIFNACNNNRYIAGVFVTRQKRLIVQITNSCLKNYHFVESKAHSRMVQRETKNGIEVFKQIKLFFNLENCNVWCSSRVCTGSTPVQHLHERCTGFNW
jgi:CHAT domain-containing protein